MKESIKLRKLLLFCSTFFITISVNAKVRLPAFFSDHMVLQQKSDVRIWGWAGAAQRLKIVPSWSGDTIKVQANGEAKWRAILKTPAAGGPYTILIISPDNKIVLEDVMIGEVWLCSGQSNMVWNSLNRHQEMLAELPQINNSQIRVLQIQRYGANTPQDDLQGSWEAASPRSIKGFSSIAYFIAKKLQKELGVPIGVINASWGGTAAEVWTPKAIINDNKVLNGFAKRQREAITRPNRPGVLWNSMIYPMKDFRIAGVYWYQGESNVPTWKGYHALFSAMIRSWRKARGYDFPFYYVQVAPYKYKAKSAGLGPYLREQQTKTLSVPKTGMVVVTDLVTDTMNIHPEKKIGVANRLADMALVEVYGKNRTDYKSPVYDRHEVKGDKVIIHFKYLSKGLTLKGPTIKNLVIAGKDHRFYPAQSVIQGKTLVVSSEEISKPMAVRFGFTDTAMPNLFNSNGLPVAPFRTDNWTD